MSTNPNPENISENNAFESEIQTQSDQKSESADSSLSSHSKRHLKAKPKVAPMYQFLSRVSGPLFWAFFIFMIFIFACYAVYFMYAVFAPLSPQFFSNTLQFLASLPNAVQLLISLFILLHLPIAVFLAFLNFAVSFASCYYSKKSPKDYFVSFFSTVKKPVLWITVLFFVFIVVGYVAGYFYPEIFEALFQFGGLPEEGSVMTLLFIFFNNIRIIFMLLFLGILFGILPVSIIIVNGFTIGLVAESTIKHEGILFLLIGLLPHSIIEIPTILLSAGIGLVLGINAAKSALGRFSFSNFKEAFIGATWFFFLIAVPLLFVAAAVEVYVTAPLLGVVF
ncbi:hypothetical protein MmiEs2_03150 [Methanimicrococcus stummii]|uniref:Stage II sporulation protein M n=1 Tax=Methanimicrococcus stummii TaxID=3028294 RepID=A0AA97A7J0_9EURY|nr:stage II sporulation protein M [Methanimicrococcus sp. Es2]WNY28133.1 hypothetical protein MmiEs2_03150 [Methanimicrococcus sp. Es2]